MKRVLPFLFLVTLIIPALAQAEDEAIAAVKRQLAISEEAFNSGDVDRAVTIFADDAVVIAGSQPVVEGRQAIEQVYRDLMGAYDFMFKLHTIEMVHAGDLVYERGDYTLKLVDKTTGDIFADLHNNHMHIFRKQPDGSWKTWRMMTNTATEPTP